MTPDGAQDCTEELRRIVHASRLEHELNALAATRMFIERVRLAPLCFSAQYQAYTPPLYPPIPPYISLYLPISPSASRRSTRPVHLPYISLYLPISPYISLCFSA